jgi:hypothetical protein
MPSVRGFAKVLARQRQIASNSAALQVSEGNVEIGDSVAHPARTPLVCS